MSDSGDFEALAEREYYDSLLGKGKGDPDMFPLITYIGEDKVVVQHSIENPHWSELPKAVQRFPSESWFDQDNSARSPLEADLEDIDQ